MCSSVKLFRLKYLFILKQITKLSDGNFMVGYTDSLATIYYNFKFLLIFRYQRAFYYFILGIFF